MELFRFEHSEYFYALLVIPVITAIFIWMMIWRKNALQRFGDWGIIQRLMPAISSRRIIFKFVLLMMAYVFLIIALANPQIGSKLVEGERKGIDIMIALDVSNSMLAQDIKPNRMERSKQAISKLIDKLGNDRIGIVVFAGNAYVQLPITTDHAAAKMFLSTLDNKIVPTQGTAIGEAIELAAKSFDDESHSRVIIIITDGEDHEDNAVKIAETVSEQGIYVYTIGMGLPEGTPIPEYDKYDRQTGYKKDRQGNTVVTRLNEKMLGDIAAAGKGIYVRANNSQAGLTKVFEEINTMEKTEFESKIFSDYESRFQYFIALSILFLLLDILIFERKNKWLSKIQLFK
ncbi:MAG: VWA domain-containing protein [Bacteroidales bacterium]|nr:VWA domain-containing protein [Bacteroidales bacterium]MCF8402976.1 VWA domain-containing protein [Bacteroidales bacterium]